MWDLNSGLQPKPLTTIRKKQLQAKKKKKKTFCLSHRSNTVGSVYLSGEVCLKSHIDLSLDYSMPTGFNLVPGQVFHELSSQTLKYTRPTEYSILYRAGILK